ncbi:unnamed protein product [Orchesella dallaii]|uniref:ER-bound oxygenase mpaB/mpaB'/Rubber oxygenase catalytic domain-containing protein n=1 Tax=Orchesella dallaii TaxID=48710 RepID=A0ABP1RM14_9HEXA
MRFFWLPVYPEEAFRGFNRVRKHHAIASKILTTGSWKHDASGFNTNELDLTKEDWMTVVADAVKMDLQCIDNTGKASHLLNWNPTLKVSQFDMMTAQMMIIYPHWTLARLFGVQSRVSEFEEPFHFWPVIGRMLGMRDEFNVCIKVNAYYYDMLIRNTIVESLKTMDKTVVKLQGTAVTGFGQHLPFLTYKAVLYVMLEELEGFDGKHIWSLMNRKDIASYYSIHFIGWLIRSNFVTRFIINAAAAAFVVYQHSDTLFTYMKG